MIGTSILKDVILDTYDFSSFSTVVDVGGPYSLLLAYLLRRYPTLLGILVAWPTLASSARRRMRAGGVADRCTVVAGNVLESVPAGGDAYVLSRVLRDCDERASLRILANCRRAMASQGRLLLVERVRPSRKHAMGSDLNHP